MATRLYFHSTTASDVNPPFNSGWNYQSEAARRKLLQAKDAGDSIALGTQIGTWTVNETALDRQYVSDPLAAQTLSGTVKCQVQVRELQAADNVFARIGVYICSEDGSTIKDTLIPLGAYGTAAELVAQTNLRNESYLDGDTITTTDVEAGDRIVVEIGYFCASDGSTPNARANWGAPSGGTDLPENYTDTDQTKVPWIEFSADITFEGAIEEAVDVTVIGTVTKSVQVNKSINITVTGAIARANLTDKLINVTGTGAVTNIKQTEKNVAITVTGSPVVAATLVFLKDVAVTVTGSVTNTMAVIFGHVANMTVTGAVTNVKAIGKNVAVTVTGTPARVNAIAKNIAVTVTGSPVMQTLGTFFHNVAMTVTGTVSTIAQLIPVGGGGDVYQTIRRAVNHYFYR